MRRAFALAVAAVLALPACGDLLDPAAAVVYGKKIPVEDVQELLDAYERSRSFKQLAAQGDEGALLREYEQVRLTGLIMRAVLVPEAEERGIEITDEDVEQRIDEFVAAEFDGSKARFEEELNEQGLTQAQFRDIVYDRILEESLRADVAGDVEPTAQDVEAFYEANRVEFETTRAQHILVDDRALAEQLTARLQASPDDAVEELFARLAKESSKDTGSARRGGDLGFQPAGTFVGPFEEALAGLDVGEISEPVRTEFGWHVIRVMERLVTPLADVRDDIADQLAGPAQDEAWNAFMEDLFEEADVEVNPRYGIFDEETREVRDADADDIPGGEAPATTAEPSAPGLPIPAPPPPG